MPQSYPRDPQAIVYEGIPASFGDVWRCVGSTPGVCWDQKTRISEGGLRAIMRKSMEDHDAQYFQGFFRLKIKENLILHDIARDLSRTSLT